MTELSDILIKHKTNVRVRYGDTDKMGVVYNGNYFYYFEIGRTEMLRAMGLPYKAFEDKGIMIPLTESRAFYKIPALYDDLLEIETFYKHSRGASPRFDYVIRRGSEVLAEGYTAHAYINSDTRRPVRPPKFFTEALESFVLNQSDFVDLTAEKA